MTWASSEAFLSENHPSFPIQEPGKIYEKRRKFHENRSYKKNKLTELYYNAKDPLAEVYTHDTKLKRRLLEYAEKYPQLCQLTEDDEQGGLRFEIAKGEFNRWIKATNTVIREIKEKIAALLDWLKETKEELSKPQTPDLISLLQIYFNQRNAGAYTQKARANNLKERSEIITFLQEHGITDVESLEAFISERRSIVDEKKTRLDIQTAEMKDLQKLPDA